MNKFDLRFNIFQGRRISCFYSVALGFVHNRYGPPSEFPSTSISPITVYQLWGLSVCRPCAPFLVMRVRCSQISDAVHHSFPTFTFIVPLGQFPMTFIHARLIGPYFKTGPESTQSNHIAR